MKQQVEQQRLESVQRLTGIQALVEECPGVLKVSVQGPEKLDRSDQLRERSRQVLAGMIDGRVWTPSTG